MPKRKACTEFFDEDGEVFACELSRNRKVVVKKFKGKVFVDIREFYNKDGQDLPSKKGISLPLDQWNIFMLHLDGILEVVESLNP